MSFKDIFKVVGPETEQAAPSGGPLEVEEQIRNDVESNRIMLYMKGTPDMPQCGFSAAVVDILNEVGVPFESRNVLADPALRQGIKDFSNWPTIPQVYVNGKFVGGCDIVTEMFERGELQPMLEEAVNA